MQAAGVFQGSGMFLGTYKYKLITAYKSDYVIILVEKLSKNCFFRNSVAKHGKAGRPFPTKGQSLRRE